MLEEADDASPASTGLRIYNIGLTQFDASKLHMELLQQESSSLPLDGVRVRRRSS